jgi:cytochrome c oxidase cbb3-type subunit III
MSRPSVIVHRCCRPAAALTLLLSETGAAFAGSASDSATETALVVTGVLTIVIIAIAFLALIIPDEDMKRLGGAAARLRSYLLPGKAENTPMIDHDFDGIHELDNRIPPWFTTLFSVTVIFGVVYMLDYHVFGTSKLSAEEYKEELAVADLHRRIIMATEGTIDENQLTAFADPAILQRAGDEFKKYCSSCHGVNGQGVVGPNLTDDYWIHGGGIRNVYTTIKQGVPAKGMISWQLVFTPKQIQEIASYVLSLRGTTPPGAKKAEGDLFVPDEQAAAPDTSKPTKQ